MTVRQWTTGTRPRSTGIRLRRTGIKRWATAAGVVSCTVAMTLVPTMGDAVAEVSRGVQIPAFYDPPATLPTANGAIVRSQPVALGVTLSLPGMSGPIPGRATLIMYKSTDSSGRPVAVTGTYLEPTNRWSAGGARPLVSFAEGTQGQGDQCSPSYGLTHALTVTTSTLSVNYEIPAIYSLLDKGIAVVVTDYVGLGTTDRLHTYVNRLDQGRAVLDAARAARSLPGTSLTARSKVATYGYSQGGGASASALELQPSYAPDVPLVGGYAGAPPANLTSVLQGIDGTALTAAIGWAVNGFVQSYPQLRPVLSANLSTSGAQALDDLSTRCVVDGIATFGFTKTTALTKSGQSLSSVIAADPTAKAIVDAQRIGTMKNAAPVRISSGTLDDFVDHAQVRQLAVDWCAKGGNVDYEPIIQTIPGGGTGLNHLVPAFSDQGAAQSWLVDRFTGRSAISRCFLVPFQP